MAPQAAVVSGPERNAARFPDMTSAWSPRLRERLHAAARAVGVELATGVYVGLLGPSYETPAEVRMLHTLGADAVGMSTVLEAVAARWVGLEVCGVSLVTNAGAGYSGMPLTHEEVLEAGVGQPDGVDEAAGHLDEPGAGSTGPRVERDRAGDEVEALEAVGTGVRRELAARAPAAGGDHDRSGQGRAHSCSQRTRSPRTANRWG